jgi:hypothetical protein
MTVDALEFIRRFLQHVLPSGFQKVRHFGFLGPNSTLSVETVRWLVTLHNGNVFSLLAHVDPVPPTRLVPRCAACGGPLTVVGVTPGLAPPIFDTS